VSAGTVNS